MKDKNGDSWYHQIVVETQNQEIERLNNIIKEQDKELELERKSRQLLTDDLANVCEMSIKKENIIKEVREICKQDIESIWKEEGAYMEYFEEIIDILDKGE